MGSASNKKTPNDWDLESAEPWDYDSVVSVAEFHRSYDLGFDHLGLLYVSLMETEPENRKLHLGRGETVSKAFVQARARMRFFWTLKDLAPHTTGALASDRGLTLMDEYAEATSQWAKQVLALHDAGSLSEETSEAASEAIMGPASYGLFNHILTWQKRFRLTNVWVMRSALFTLTAAQAYQHEFGIPYDGPLSVRNVAVSVHDDKERRWQETERSALSVPPEHLLKDVPIVLGMLRNTPQRIDYRETDDGGQLGTFDPRLDSIEEATDRLLEALRPRVRRALDAIVAADRQLNGAQPPVNFRSTAAFEWLVRYQVNLESMRAIARADGKDPGHISREIHRAKDLIGLTLRSPERSGRPPKRHARTVKVLR